MTPIPGSILTIQRPDIWLRGLTLATRLTGYSFPAKLPLSDGTIYACGVYPYPAPKPPNPEEQKKKEQEEKDREIEWAKSQIKYHEEDLANAKKRKKNGDDPPPAYRREQYPEGDYWDHVISDSPKRISYYEETLKKLQLSVLVPEGGMEWLLHEVGHWVAAAPEERLLPNYGYESLFAGDTAHGDDREWQAWAFEEIILAPHGPARTFAAPTCRDGVGFTKNAIPLSALTHIERRLRQDRIDVEEWRAVFGDWVKWGNELGQEAPWRTSK